MEPPPSATMGSHHSKGRSTDKGHTSSSQLQWHISGQPQPVFRTSHTATPNFRGAGTCGLALCVEAEDSAGKVTNYTTEGVSPFRAPSLFDMAFVLRAMPWRNISLCSVESLQLVNYTIRYKL